MENRLQCSSRPVSPEPFPPFTCITFNQKGKPAFNRSQGVTTTDGMGRAMNVKQEERRVAEGCRPTEPGRSVSRLRQRGNNGKGGFQPVAKPPPGHDSGRRLHDMKKT